MPYCFLRKCHLRTAYLPLPTLLRTHTHTHQYINISATKMTTFPRNPDNRPKSVSLKRNLLRNTTKQSLIFLICLDLIINNNYCNENNRFLESIEKKAKQNKNSALNLRRRHRRWQWKREFSFFFRNKNNLDHQNVTRERKREREKNTNRFVFPFITTTTTTTDTC